MKHTPLCVSNGAEMAWHIGTHFSQYFVHDTLPIFAAEELIIVSSLLCTGTSSIKWTSPSQSWTSSYKMKLVCTHRNRLLVNLQQMHRQQWWCQVKGSVSSLYMWWWKCALRVNRQSNACLAEALQPKASTCIWTERCLANETVAIMEGHEPTNGDNRLT